MALKVNNFTPLANLRYSNLDASGREFGVLIIKATFDVGGDLRCVLSDEQEPLALTDGYHGALNTSAMRYPSDLVPFKPKTDVLFDSVARAPGGKELPSWVHEVCVEDEAGTQVRRSARVWGPREWRPKWRRELSAQERPEWRRARRLFAGWELSAPQPAVEVPMRYDLAYGGLLPKGEDQDGNPLLEAYQYNPIGRGWLDEEWSDHTQPHPAPQIEDAAVPVTTPYQHYAPCGLGPIPPAWLPRRPLGGTYDQNWIENVWPNWPSDYDFAYHNSSSLTTDHGRYLAGRITCTIRNRSNDRQDERTIVLPNPTVVLTLFGAGLQELATVALDIDTIFVAAAERQAEEWRVFVSGRLTFDPENIETINIHRIEDERVSPSMSPARIFPPASSLPPAFNHGTIA